MAGNVSKPEPSASENLEILAKEAISVSKKAKRNRKSLSGDNFYGNKLATLRSDATNAYRRLTGLTSGDSSAIADLVERIFDGNTAPMERALAYRELTHGLRTIWKETVFPQVDEGLFPLSILTQANRGYLVTIGRQMNGAFTSGWYDAAAVMMRRLVETAIIEAFEGKGIAGRIKDASGDYVQLSDLIGKTLAESSWTLSRNARKVLPLLRDLGHKSAHGRYFTARKEDLEEVKSGSRIVVEELLHHSGLL